VVLLYHFYLIGFVIFRVNGDLPLRYKSFPVLHPVIFFIIGRSNTKISENKIKIGF